MRSVTGDSLTEKKAADQSLPSTLVECKACGAERLGLPLTNVEVTISGPPHHQANGSLLQLP